MTDSNLQERENADDLLPQSEGGLRAPPGLGFWGKTWWWFHFLILVKIARLRFIGILLLIGLVIVKWDLLDAYYEKWARSATAALPHDADAEYFCPMHPTVIRDSPKEKCPICFMPLSKRKKGEASVAALPPGIVNRVQLSPYRVVLAGIRTSTVSYVPLTKEIITVGWIEFNERELKHIAARVKGRIDKLFVNQTGEWVHKGDELASLYSPDLVVTVENLLLAHQSKNAVMERSARDRLTLWGISKDQIEEILKSGKANTHLKIRSPIKGHVTKKYVKEGQYVDEGSPLYDLADLATVWIQAQVYETDIPFLPPTVLFHKGHGDLPETLPVTATSLAYPAEKFSGKLTFVYPHVDEDSRTVLVRFELPNPEHKLLPGTTATVTLKVAPSNLPFLTKALAEIGTRESALAGALWAQQALFDAGAVAGVGPLIHAAGLRAMLSSGLVLAVPESAVIDTGAANLVYREVLPGEYEGVKVELGPRMAGPGEVTYYPVLGGVEAGDVIVTSGSFLVDAETRLNPAAGSIYFGGSGSKGTSTTSTVRPSTPDDPDAKVTAALAKLDAADRRLAEAQVYCPILSHNRLGSMGVPVKLVLQGQPVFLCCSGCEQKARANAKKTLAKVEELKSRKGTAAPTPALSEAEREIQAELAKMTPGDRRLAEAQRLCPITGARLGSMGIPAKIMIQGQPVFLCCQGCKEKALADPEKTMAKVKTSTKR
jgi:Cu(I)/Ag(I) efflux system membrane fusion protein